MGMSKKKKLWLHLCLFIIGGVGYVLIELMWRRRSHVSMFFVGGLCFELMGMIHTRLKHWVLPLRCGLCALAVSAVELVSGCILNRWLRLGVWDYSKMRFHLLGQVSLGYSSIQPKSVVGLLAHLHTTTLILRQLHCYVNYLKTLILVCVLRLLIP